MIRAQAIALPVRQAPLSLRYEYRWVKLTGAVIFITTLVFMLAETSYLTENRFANIARWSLLALLSGLNLIRPKRHLRSRKPLTVDAMAAVFLVFAAASALYSIAPSLTLLRTGTVLLLYLAVFWTVWNYANLAGGDRVTDTLIMAASLILAAGVAASILPSLAGSEAGTWAWMGGRFRGIMANPNAIGMMGILFLPLVVSRFMRRRRTLDLALLALIVGTVVLSGSRNGVLAASISVLYLLLRSRAWKAGLALAAVTAVLYLAMTSYVSFQDVAVTQGIARLAPDETLRTGGGRVEAWQVAIPLIQKQLIFGHGFGTEELIFRGMKFHLHVGAYVHNSYLGIAYQLGLVGASLLFLPLIGLFIRRQFVRERSIRMFGYEAMLLGGIAASFLESWIYSVGNAFAFPFWICVMLLVRASRIPAGEGDAQPIPRKHVGRPLAGPRYLVTALPRPPREPAIPRFDPPSPQPDAARVTGSRD
jgi:O-antigen ligase